MVKERNPADIWKQSADPSKLDLSGLPQTAKEMKAVLRKRKGEDEKYNKDLRDRARTPKQLTGGLECTVLEINGYQNSTSFTPRSEMVIGGHSRSYRSGHVYRAEIKVQSGTLVEQLEFNGWPNLETGDMIKAYIFKGKKEYERGRGFTPPENVEELPDFHREIFRDIPFHWVDRPYKSVEQPSKIEKLRDGKVVATYYNS